MKIFTYKKLDISLLMCALILVAIGLLFVYSASFYNAEEQIGNKYFYLTKQALGAVIGMVSMLLCAFVNLEQVKKISLPLLIISAILLALVFVPGLGIESYGAVRWLGIGGFHFQPSEIAKFAFVLFCASYMSSPKVNISRFTHALPVVASGGVLCVLIILEPNMSITVCLALILLTMLFLGGMRIRAFLICLIPLVVAIPVLIIAEPYRFERLLAFLDPWASPKDEGYQLIQSLYALGSGGPFGVGLFNSRQKYKFLPFAESDFVFSIIGEEIGFVGCSCVILLYGFLIYKGIKIAVYATDKYKCFLAGGITSVIAIQSLVNFAVVTGSIPPTGLPLPFISYGGTSLVVFMSAVGLLLNVEADSIMPRRRTKYC